MALLTAHILNGKVVGTQLQHYSVIEVPFKIEDTPSLGYVDISSIENWWKFGLELNRDFLFVRKEIKKLVEKLAIDSAISTISDPPSSPVTDDTYYIDPLSTATGDWTNYEGYIASWNGSSWLIEPACHFGYRLANVEEKLICAELKIGGQADHFADYGVPSIVDYGVDYHKKAIETRQERMLRATVEVYNRLPLNSYEVLTNLTASPLGDMIGRYEKYGVKGTAEDYNIDFNPNPTPGLLDYIKGRAPFNNQEPYVSQGYPAGLALKDWSPIDAASISEFADDIYDILVNGKS